MARQPEDRGDDRPIESGQDYEVGYGKPPKHSRFAPGRSGNPKGRPRGSQNFDTLLGQELDKLIPVREGGKVRKMSKRSVLVTRLVNKAIDSDPRSVQVLLPMVNRLDGERARRDDGQSALAPEDAELIEDFVARRRAISDADDKK